MSDQTVEAPVYKQTTFADVQKHIEQAEQVIPTETTVVNESGNLEVPATEQPTAETTIPTETAPAEENVSAFDLGEPDPTTTTVTEKPTFTPPSYNLDEEIKKVDRKELLKKVGVSDFAIEMDEYLAKGGNATDYISKKGYDWNKISDEDLVKSDLRNLYPDAQQSQIDRLYNKKYNQRDEDLEDDKEDGTLLMRADARRLREAKITEQNSFKIPDAIIPQTKDEAYEQWKQMQDTQPALMRQLNEFYQNHEATKSLNESKRVAINLGEGVPAFNFSINNPDAVTRMYTDGGETWQKLTSTQTGEPDVAKQQLIGLFSYNPQKFAQDIFNYGVQMGKKKLVEEGMNAQRPQQKPLPQEFNQTSYGVGKFADKGRN